MKKVLSILIAFILVLSLLAGCGGNENNVTPNGDPAIDTGYTDDDNDFYNDDGENEEGDPEDSDNNTEDDAPAQIIVPTPYEPDPEGMIGIAFYPVPEGKHYPYAIGEKVTDFSDWKYLYSTADINNFISIEQMEADTVFDDNIINRTLRIGKSSITVTGIYKTTATEGYWGYVYQTNGEIYIIATHDAWKNDGNDPIDSRKFNVNGLNLRLSCHVVTPKEIPDYYNLVCVLDNYIREAHIYAPHELPEKIETMKNFDELDVDHFTGDRYLSSDQKHFYPGTFFFEEIGETDDGGILYSYNGYKGEESYEYYVTVYPVR